jgi:glycine cleavage system aminomethyltransferase T
MAIPSPHLNGQFLGLARIDKTYSAVGTELNLATGGRAKIMAMPVYDPQRIRARS